MFKFKILLIFAPIFVMLGCETYPAYTLLPPKAKEKVDICSNSGGTANVVAHNTNLSVSCWWVIK